MTTTFHPTRALLILAAASLALAASDFVRYSTRSSVPLSEAARAEGLVLAVLIASATVVALLTQRAARLVLVLGAVSAFLVVDALLGITPLGASTPWSLAAAVFAGVGFALEVVRLRPLSAGLRAAIVGVLLGVALLATLALAGTAAVGVP